MKTEVLRDAEAVAQRGAALIAAQAREAVKARGQFTWAVSGGSTPWRMLTHLVNEDVPWAQVHVFQVDERVVETSSPARNFTQLAEHLLKKVPLSTSQVHAMNVADQLTLDQVALDYADQLQKLAGAPPQLDLVHLGLGTDGHTASLFEGDPATNVTNTWVAVTQTHAGFRRLTLTYPVLAAARSVLWVVAGADKADALRKLLAGDGSIPAGRVSAKHATVLADTAAIASTH